MSGQLSIIERARLYLAKVGPAVSGSGGHEHTLLTARALVRGFLLHEADALALLGEWNAGNEEKWSVKELEHKIRSVQKGPPPPKGDGWLLDERDERPLQMIRREGPPPVVAEKPVYKPEALEAFAGEWARKVDLVWLANRSVAEPATLTASAYLDLLYRRELGEKVVVFTEQYSQGEALWPDEVLPETGREGVWYLAQPVDGTLRPNPRNVDEEGRPKMSRRSEESIRNWRYLLLESDEAPARLWLGALVQLPLRIAAIYTSGSRSVHVLVRVDAPTKRAWDDFKRGLSPGLVALGADPGALSAVRLTRLPGCYREGTKPKGGPYRRYAAPSLQKLLYVNPDPAARPLIELTARRDVVERWTAEVTEMAMKGWSGRSKPDVQRVLDGCRYYANVSPTLAGHVGELEEVCALLGGA